MRVLLFAAASAALLAALPVWAQNNGAVYKIDYDGTVDYKSYDEPGKKGLYGKVHFRLSILDGARASENDSIVISEDGKEVKRLPIVLNRAKEFTTVLALDRSASMGFGNKLGEARTAAGVFLDRLGSRVDTGLILFNDQVPINDAALFRRPSGSHQNARAQTETIRGLINQVQPAGGSAYRNATAKAIDMLAQIQGERAVVVMTDGLDVNSRPENSLPELIKKANSSGVPVYTIGIGAPNLNAVLVLDQSGSMAAPANGTDKKRKIDALHEAGKNFIERLRPGARATLIPFSTDVANPLPFTDDKPSLISQIQALEPKDGTSLYDATMTAVETLVAANQAGNRVVVVLTDGKDESPGSRYSYKEVIDRAREVGIKLYMLGLGRKKEINEPVMTRMARETGGEYFYLDSAAKLIGTFENLSADLNNVEALRELAEKTHGKYYNVQDVAQLQLAFNEVAATLDEDKYTEEFKSKRDVLDGTARTITIRVKGLQGGQDLSGGGAVGAGNVHGLVVPEKSPLLYLLLLGCVAGCLALPQRLRRLRGNGIRRA